MVKVELKGLKKIKKKSGTYWYFRGKGDKLIPVKGEYGSAEFLENYAHAQTRKASDGSNTIDALIKAYISSSEFPLSGESKKNHLRELAHLSALVGDAPVDVMSDKRFRRDVLERRDEMIEERGPRAAQYFIQVSRAMTNWAYDRGYIDYAHLSRPGNVYQSDRSDRIWSPADIGAFMAHGYYEINLAVTFGLFLGQRSNDLRSLQRSQYQDGAFTITQSKTGRTVFIPVHKSLKRIMERMPCPKFSDGRNYFLTSKKGYRWKARNFKRQHLSVRRAAGLADRVTFNDLRGTAITTLSEAGCTVPQISPISGHSMASVNKILEKYLARTMRLAKSATARLQESKLLDYLEAN